MCLLVIWLAAIALATTVDRPIAQFVHDHGGENKHAWSRGESVISFITKLPGEYPFILAVAAAVGIWHRRHWQGALLVALAGLISSLNGLLKWVVGRHRPITGIHPFELHPFAGGIRGLWMEKNLCFPSGHAALAFAAAAALAICMPRWRLLLFLIATLTGIERIAENAHYPSDVVAAALLGVVSANIAAMMVSTPPVRAAQSGVSLPP